jgi:hypothetical protein
MSIRCEMRNPAGGPLAAPLPIALANLGGVRGDVGVGQFDQRRPQGTLDFERVRALREGPAAPGSLRARRPPAAARRRRRSCTRGFRRVTGPARRRAGRRRPRAAEHPQEARVRAQHAALTRRLRGHFNYFGVSGNFRSLLLLVEETRRGRYKWLCRRSQRRGPGVGNCPGLLDSPRDRADVRVRPL